VIQNHPAPPSKNKKKTKIMKIEIYTTKAGMKFKFGFEEREVNQEKHFTVLILEQPGYAGRDDSLHATHRIREGDNCLIDWPGPAPTLDDAKIVAACWSDLTERYIAHGKPFSENQN
jgi:hypothetical protein